jgi:omega-6 fatty acid desaturase (delta-12 desaturase)
MMDDDPSATRVLAQFARPSLARASWQLANTLLPFVGLWIAAVCSWRSGWSYFATAGLILLAAGFFVRLFMLQHDCSHGSFLASARANRWLGACLGFVTLFPFSYWKKTHAVHHATSGNLDRRELGDIRTLTVREYQQRSRWGRLGYRIYRSVPLMLGVGPLYQFVAKHRLPIGMPWRWKKEWRSVTLNNVGLTLAGAVLWIWPGWQALLAVHLPIVAVAGAIGVWLFYVQHTFEGGYWTRAAGWDARKAAVEGSAYYDLPAVLRWMTGNIGYHHVHHLAPRIPNYHLAAAHAALRSPPGLRRLSLWSSLACGRLKLWDESLGRMVGFPSRVRNP